MEEIEEKELVCKSERALKVDKEEGVENGRERVARVREENEGE